MTLHRQHASPGSLNDSSLLVWRVEDIQENDGFFDQSDWVARQDDISCPFCSGQTAASARLSMSRSPWRDYLHCLLCGWSACSSYRYGRRVGGDAEHLRAVVRRFSASSEEVALSELGTYIRQHPGVLDAVSWRRFEQLVADVFRHHGYRPLLTQASRDGGADVILFAGTGRQPVAIVECKRYLGGRRVKVDLVHKLAGAAIDWDVQKAYLVTSSDFSKGAREAAARLRSRGYEFELVAMSDLLELLQVYNAKLPRLELLSAQDRQTLIEANRQTMLRQSWNSGDTILNS